MEIKIYEHIPEAARKIREEVFVREQGFEYEFDDIDNRAVHLVMYEAGNPVETTAILPNLYVSFSPFQ